MNTFFVNLSTNTAAVVIFRPGKDLCVTGGNPVIKSIATECNGPAGQSLPLQGNISARLDAFARMQVAQVPTNLRTSLCILFQ